VWTLSRELGSEIYSICSTITRPEARLITSQLRRSALSISANIAEGCGKSSRAETIRYLEIAGGSAAETEHHLIVAVETGVMDAESGARLLARITSVRRMLRALIDKLPNPGGGTPNRR
jgi:four helix bundle protein